jgi:aquaporin Z
MEGWGLGTFTVSAGLCGTVIFHPASPLALALAAPLGQRALMGALMGLTAVGIIHSPWGQQSGAHLNPAVTLSFLRLGKIAVYDAVLYVLAQVLGGLVGVLLVIAALGHLFTDPPVSHIATLPGTGGVGVALLAEVTISALLMGMVLVTTASPHLMRLTGVLAGCLVALFIAVEAPLSGMSMNPARSLASALPSGLWQGFWLYVVGPPLGMLLAVELNRLVREVDVPCAKLNHHTHRRCIFRCGHQGR